MHEEILLNDAAAQGVFAVVQMLASLIAQGGAPSLVVMYRRKSGLKSISLSPSLMRTALPRFTNALASTGSKLGSNSSPTSCKHHHMYLLRQHYKPILWADQAEFATLVGTPQASPHRMASWCNFPLPVSGDRAATFCKVAFPLPGPRPCNVTHRDVM